MPDNTSTSLDPWKILLGLQSPQPSQSDFDQDTPISGFTGANTVGVNDLDSAIQAHSQTPEAQQKKSFGDHLKDFGKTFAKNFAEGFVAQHNPELFRQREEDQRQNQLLQAQSAQRQTVSASEQAQLNAQQGAEVLRALMGGAHVAGQGETPSYTLGSTGLVFPQAQAEPNIKISADSDIGKYLGLNGDMTLPQSQYISHVLPALGQFHTSSDKQTQAQAHLQAVDHALQVGMDEINSRFAGSQDPQASFLKQNKIDALNAAAESDKKSGTLTAISAVLNHLPDQTNWEKTQEANASRQAQIADRQAARIDTATDRSYQFHVKELDQLAKPVNDAIATYSKIRETLDQGGPTAMATLAPQVIKFVAGGAGSGVRITQPEINSLVGGRNNWDALNALAAKWDPATNKPVNFTPAQLSQVRSLVDGIGKKIIEKQDSLNKGYADLAGSNSVQDHRRIYDRTRKAVIDVDTPQSNGSLIDSLVSKYGGK